jgi:polyribonucleotide nucleotidyltransferase
LRNLRNEFIEAYKTANAENAEINLAQHESLIKRYFHDVEKEAMRRMILDDGIRLDGGRNIKPNPPNLG